MQFRLLLSLFLLATSGLAQDRPIRVPLDPHVTPDGRHAVFSWHGDLWKAPLDGSPAPAARLTVHPGRDWAPIPSPDGEQVLFLSDRDGTTQLWLVGIDGGAPRRLTFDSESKTPLQWTAAGSAVVALRDSDRAPFSTESRRLVRIPIDRSEPERWLLDAGAIDGALSPDGTRLLFVRGRIQEERKGYRGPAAEQIWLARLEGESAPQLARHSVDLADFQNVSERHPLWLPDGSGYLFVSDPDGTFDLWKRALPGGEVTRLTDLRKLDGRDDGVVAPSLSADGKRVLFRRGFDLHVADLGSGAVRRVDLVATGDPLVSPIERRRLDSAGDVAFTGDGKQIALVAGHDLYVMDRVLREPVRITATAAVESSPLFSADGSRLFFVSEADGEVDIWEATRPEGREFWWTAESFVLRKVTDDVAVESRLQPSPTGEHIAFRKGGDLWVMDADGSDQRRVLASWDGPDFDWSPDGKWLCWSVQDGEFNDEIWIAPLDGTRAPFNVSRHPDDDTGPVWSPDGKRIAWTGRRDGEESDIYYVTLTKDVAEETSRDRKLEEAMKAMQSGGKGGKKDGEQKDGDEKSEKDAAGDDAAKQDDDAVRIDFDGIHDRIGRIRIPESREFGLLWSHDGKELWFSATVDGERAVYKVGFPDELRPKKVTSSVVSRARFTADGKQLVGLSGGKPASQNPSSGKIDTFDFQVQEERDWREIRKLAFEQGWRAMRDQFYDGALNNRDWNAIRARYAAVVPHLIGAREFSEAMNMMLGELNASHMGHRGGSDPLPDAERPDWSPRTMHLGLRYDLDDAGPGLLVASVIPGSPCSEARSRVDAGERVLAIDGTEVGPDTDLFAVMTLEVERDMELKVRGAEGVERTVTVRPVGSVSGLLYDEWVDDCRAEVERLSGGKLGYAHIRGMNFQSFRQLEEDLYAAGAGKDGLIIDVRFNGGGSTADHVLTLLTQPTHAFTIPRGGPTGYPQDRKVYATWNKPIVMMCNEMSFSNAEIVSHAVKTIGRGPVVGMRTAGGVISTGGQGLVDGSFVRMPFRGWYLVNDGADMELNGCLPDVALWNDPLGGDAQLEAAVTALRGEVETKGRPLPEAKPAASLRRGG